MGLLWFTYVCHRIFSFLLSIRDRGYQPSRCKRKKRKKEVFVAKRCEDLEVLHERREESQEYNRGYRQRMTEAYGRTIKEKVFA